MKNLFNKQLKYLSFHTQTLPRPTIGLAYSKFSSSSISSHIISGSSFLINKKILNVTKKNELSKINTDIKYSNYDKNKIPSVFIHSPLEHSDSLNILDKSPVEDILLYIFSFNVLILILIFIFLFLIFNRFILKSNSRGAIEIIKSFIDKNMPTKFKVWTANKLNYKEDKGIDYNNRFMLFIFIINSIILIAIIFLNLYASSELLNNIDEYVKVYNYLNNNNNKSILLIIPFIPKNSKLFNYMRNDNNRINLENCNKWINTSSIQDYNKKSEIVSVNNLTSPELTDSKKEKSKFSSPLNLVNTLSKFNDSKQASLHLSKNIPNVSNKSRKLTKLTEGDWREMWSRKFKKFIRLGFYTPDLSDKLLFVYLNDKKENIQSKYTFNNFLSSSQLISYKFNKNIKKVDLNSLYKYLKSFFKTLSSLISFPVLDIYSDKIKIRLFYYVVPSKNKQNIQTNLHRYIRSDEKLYKETILRKIFKSKMEQFKMKLFFAKWKEDNFCISIPNPISIFKGLSVGQLTEPLNDSSLLGLGKAPCQRLREDLEQLSPRPFSLKGGEGAHFRSPNDEFNRPYEYNTPLDLLKLDSSKLSQLPEQLDHLSPGPGSLAAQSLGGTKAWWYKGLAVATPGGTKPDPDPVRARARAEGSREVEAGGRSRLTGSILCEIDLNNTILDKKNIITDIPGISLEDHIKENKFEAEERQSNHTKAGSPLGSSMIYLATDAPEALLEVSSAEQTTKSPVILKNLKDRKVSTIVSLNKDKFKYLIFTLEKLFKKTIILDLVRLKYPYHESNILAQVLSLSCKTKDFRQIMRKLLYTATISNPTKIVRKQNFSIIPSYLSGIKVRLGGRLITQRIVPRFTVQSLQIGSLARGKVNFTNSSRITLKNKRGAFSFTVTTSHIFDK